MVVARLTSMGARRAGGILLRPLCSPITPILARASSGAALDPKIGAIVDSIQQLTLLETASLVSELKTRLNITEVAMPAAAAPAAGAPAAAAEEVKEEVEERHSFGIKLEAFDAASKAKVIKEVKNLLGLNLVDAKKMVEAAPKVLKSNVPKEDAENVKKVLEGLGAKVTLE